MTSKEKNELERLFNIREEINDRNKPELEERTIPPFKEIHSKYGIFTSSVHLGIIDEETELLPKLEKYKDDYNLNNYLEKSEI